MRCKCPLGQKPNISTYDGCPQNVGQVQKLMFMPVGTAVPDANDGSKVPSGGFVTNYIFKPEFATGEAITFGSGNDVIDGEPILIGRKPTVFTFELYNEMQANVEILKNLQCLAEAGKLSVALINGDNKVIGVASGHKIYGIKVEKFFISDLVLGGLENPDTNKGSISFSADWSDKLVK